MADLNDLIQPSPQQQDWNAQQPQPNPTLQSLMSGVLQKPLAEQPQALGQTLTDTPSMLKMLSSDPDLSRAADIGTNLMWGGSLASSLLRHGLTQIPMGALRGTAGKLFEDYIAPAFGSTQEFADKFFAGMAEPGAIRVSTEGNELHLAGSLSKDGQYLGEIHRVIDPVNGTADHEYLRLADDVQQSGIAKNLLASQVDAYQRLGINRVTTNANIDVGAYAWSKYGFTPSQQYWPYMAKGLQNKVSDLARYGQIDADTAQSVSKILESNDPKSIWNISDLKLPTKDGTPLGKKLLMGRGSGWMGTLDLKDPETMARFNDYVGKGKASAPVAPTASPAVNSGQMGAQVNGP